MALDLVSRLELDTTMDTVKTLLNGETLNVLEAYRFIAMSSSTTDRKPVHEYQLRDQTGDHARKRKSVLIGKLPHTGKRPPQHNYQRNT